jgi:ABC-type sugar transport system ATPase subunit
VALQQVALADPLNEPEPSGSAQSGPSAPLLRVSHISKSFAGTRVLDEVCLEVFSGEVVAVVGQNGSGKSTLVKVLAGVHQPDPGGAIEVMDAEGQPLGSHGAHQQNLHFIHQDLGLLPMLSTTENLDLGRFHGLRGFLPGNRREEHRRATDLVSRFGAIIDVRAPVATLSPAERTIVAIARAMAGWRRPDNVLILDEPTAAFHRDECGRLFEAIRRVAAQGAGVIFISHRLDEVQALADRVIALRDGRIVGEAISGQFDQDTLVKAILGEAVAETRKEKTALRQDVVFRVDALSGKRLHAFSFSVRQGEVLGIAGVLGSGREELGPLVFGAERRTGGLVEIDGFVLPPGDMATAIDHGVALVPADRRRHGAVMEMNVRENLTLPRLGKLRRRFGRIDMRAERVESRHWASSIGLRPLEPEKPLAQLSGGNQQKVVLAKWLSMRPRLLLLDEPTQGVDVGAKAAIYELILRAASEGAGVIVASSDTKELVAICDRVIVLEGGHMASERAGDDLNEGALLRDSLGVRSHTEKTIDGFADGGGVR